VSNIPSVVEGCSLLIPNLRPEEQSFVLKVAKPIAFMRNIKLNVKKLINTE